MLCWCKSKFHAHMGMFIPQQEDSYDHSISMQARAWLDKVKAVLRVWAIAGIEGTNSYMFIFMLF